MNDPAGKPLGRGWPQQLAQLLDVVSRWINSALILVALVLFLGGMLVRALAPTYAAGGWINEITVYLIIWATLFAVADASARRAHIRSDLVLGHVPPKVRKALEIFAALCTLAFLLALGYFGYLTVEFALRLDERGPSVLRIPTAYYYLCMPTAMFLAFIRSVLPPVKEREEDSEPEPMGGAE